jgi:hypothetical protein
MYRLQSSTHSSQMKICAGPATSFSTSCCDFMQNEQ